MPSVFVSTVIDAPADRVWEVLRDYNGLPDWHPAIHASRIEDGLDAAQVGCVRALTVADGGIVRERLLALSDYDMSYRYSILESPFGLENYVATPRLTPVTDGARCFAEWSAEFDCAPGRERELVEFVGRDVFQGGFDALKARFSR